MISKKYILILIISIIILYFLYRYYASNTKNTSELIVNTSPPYNTTVPPYNTTVPPYNTTVPPYNTTVPPYNTTVPPYNTTVPSKSPYFIEGKWKFTGTNSISKNKITTIKYDLRTKVANLYDDFGRRFTDLLECGDCFFEDFLNRMHYDEISGYFQFYERNIGSLQYPYLLIDMIPNSDNTVLIGYYKSGAESHITLTKVEDILRMPPYIKGIWKVYVGGNPDGIMNIDFDIDTNMGTVDQKQNGINLGYTMIKYGGYNGDKFVFGNSNDIENSSNIFKLNEYGQLKREDRNAMSLIFVKEPITPAPTTPAPTTPIPNTPVPTSLFSSSFEGIWKLIQNNQTATVTISASGLYTFNISGLMSSGIDLPNSFKLMTVDPNTLSCSFPRLQSSYYNNIESVIINKKVVDISNSVISLTRTVDPISTTLDDPVEGRWSTFSFMDIGYGPINITLFKPKHYYISGTIDGTNIQFDGRILNIDDNGNFILTRRNIMLNVRIIGGIVTRLSNDLIYISRPDPITLAPTTPVPSTPIPTTPIPTTPIPTSSFSSSFEGRWRLKDIYGGRNAIVDILASGLNTFNIIGRMDTGSPLPFTVLTINPENLLCSFGDNYNIEPIIINGKVVDMSSSLFSLTRPVDPTLNTSNSIEGTWNVYRFSGVSYNPVNVSLVKPKHYYISYLADINTDAIPYDGRLLNIDTNELYIITRRNIILIPTLTNGLITRLMNDQENSYLDSPISGQTIVPVQTTVPVQITTPVQITVPVQTTVPVQRTISGQTPSWYYVRSGNNTWGDNPAYGKSVRTLDEAKIACSGYNSLAYYNSVWANCFNTSDSIPKSFSSSSADLYKFY